MRNKHEGARSELIAIAWLLSQGYEVFRNVSPFGIVDIIAIRNTEWLKFDVKTTKPQKKIRLSMSQIENGILPLYVYPDGTCAIDYEPASKLPTEVKQCICCGKSFETNRKTKKYCSKKCCTKFTLVKWRRANGTPTREKWLAEHPQENTAPWKQKGISRSEWYRRKAERTII